MKIQYVIAFLFLINIATFAQDLGKVTKAELEEKFYPTDTSAAAAVLFTKGRTKFSYNNTKGWVSQTTFDIKIKIYKKEGLQWADFEVPYYVGYENLSADYVEFSKGVTYNLENGKIEKTSLSGQGTFKETVNKLWKKKSITMPDVKVGSVIEFRYTLKSEDLVRLPDFKFQYSIPVKYAEYISEIPESFVYNEIIRGFLKIESTKKAEGNSQTFVNEHNSTDRIEYFQVKSVHKVENVPALKDEPFVNNIDNYRATLIQELKMTLRDGKPHQKFAESWEDVATSIYKSDDFGKQIQTRQYFENELKPLIENISDKQERLTTVLRFVKAKVKWDGSYGVFTSKGVKKAYAERSGNVAEVNMILIATLNYAGIYANPVLVSTRSNGIAVFPTRTAFNYLIVQAVIDENKVFLDATEQYSVENILPMRAINWTGRLIRDGGVNEETDLTPIKPSKVITNAVVKVEANGTLNGKIKIQKLDYYAFSHRELFNNQVRETYLENLENSLNKIEISEYVLENENDNKNPIIESFTFKSDNHIEIIAGKIYINPLLCFAESSNIFKQDNREFPIDFGFPNEHKYNISIEIPEGYAVESLPQSVNIGTEGKIGNFKYALASTGNKIQVSVSSSINLAIVDASYYKTIKDYYQKMIDKQNEKIILKKV